MSTRPPFDPDRLRRPTAGKPPEKTPALLSVRQVNDLIRGAIAAHLPATLHVLGEIGDLSCPSSGHVYFSLKDALSELRCVLWRSTVKGLKFVPEPGMAVIATGSIEVYAQRGTYQLIVRRLEPRGVGALEVAFRQLRERLEREGLFDARRKKALPRIPERVAIVTSPTGAAIRDMLQTLARRFPAIEVFIYPVRVQGDGAAEEIAAAIQAVNQHAAALGGIDVLIAGRGGGSLEDLWAFNEEVVARAIAASRIPVVSAVGHEVDITISDLVADLRAPTPTAAAELIAPTRVELLETVELSMARAARTLTHAVALSRANLTAVLAYDGFARPLLWLRQYVQLVDELQQRLRRVLGDAHQRARAALDARELALLRFGTGVQFTQARHELDRGLHQLWKITQARTQTAERRLVQQLARLERASPRSEFKQWAEHVRQMHTRVSNAGRTLLAQRRGRLDACVQAVVACDPRQVLKRGYSLTRDARTRRLIRSVTEIRDRLRIVTELADGEFRSTAEDPRQPNLFDPPPPSSA